MSQFDHPRDEILHAMARIYSYRMTTTSGGNLSIREPNGDIWITPARVDKGGLRRDDIVLVRADGSVDGTRLPSSELPLHQAIYRARPDLRGIVHAHPVALVAFSLVRRIPNTRLFHKTREVCGEGAFATYEVPGSEALGRTVAGSFAQGSNSVILENHGVVTAGASLQQAFQRFETFEFTGKTIIKALLLGNKIDYLTDDQIKRAAAPRPAFPELDEEPPSSKEKELRRSLSQFVLRAYRQRLFISTQGSFSLRLDPSSFLITPHLADRNAICAEQVVLVRGGRVKAGETPSYACNLHSAIYRDHPDVGAIINAYPVNATAFSITGTELDTRTIPESYVVVRRPATVPYGLQFDAPDVVSQQLTSDTPALVLQGDGVLVTGKDALEAFDRLEVLESTAEALINARPLGALSPMSEEAIRELDSVFFNK